MNLLTLIERDLYSLSLRLCSYQQAARAERDRRRLAIAERTTANLFIYTLAKDEARSQWLDLYWVRFVRAN